MGMTTLSNAIHALAPGLRVGTAYSARLASTPADLKAAQALRFEVFNLELDEGLAMSYDTGLDADPFDAVCDHLIVEDLAGGGVVGTYRMQTGAKAAQALGYYSEREFDFGPFEQMRSEILELGRACIHQRHRNFAVLNHLWKGVATYARAKNTRYLMGCSSLTSRDASVGVAAWSHLAPYRALAAWCTNPTPRFACPLDAPAGPPPKMPKLLLAYLRLGATICAPPAIDREFGTIDFLTWLDIESPSMAAMQRRGRFVA